MSDKDQAELDQRRTEELMESMVDQRISKAICGQWNVEWSASGSHTAELAKRRIAMDRILAEQARADRRREKVEGSMIEKAMGWIAMALAGAASIIGLHYANKYGKG